jgi:FkbM family methyltransferase
MKKVLVALVRNLALKFNVAIIKKSSLDLITSRLIHLEPFERWASPSVSPDLREWVLANMSKSKAQLQQDLFVSYFFPNLGSGGFFVEFGATNGISLSNSYFLENEFEWDGILAEPGRIWHEELTQNRNCKIEYDCVYGVTGEVIQFSEVDVPELSTISTYQESDSHSEFRKKNARYNVSTVSLHDLLLRNNAPRAITYLSIDTEGSEYDILKDFPFENWDISIITVEHNYTEIREKLDFLLQENGFTRVLEDVSRFDSWYLSSKIHKRFQNSLEQRPPADVV